MLGRRCNPSLIASLSVSFLEELRARKIIKKVKHHQRKDKII
jgi:hypothetical protein